MNEQHSDVEVARPVIEAGNAVPNCLESETASQPSSDDPQPATIAAIEFQVACLLNDQYATVNWRERDPLVVNQPGDVTRKYETLRRIAKASFPYRGDVLDVLDGTLNEYGLWRWANPLGFWIAFKRDMMDAKKAAFETKRVHLEQAGLTLSDGIRSRCNSCEWTASEGSHKLDKQIAQSWLCEQYSERKAADLVAQKWELVKASRHHLDRLIVKAIGHAMGDQDYLEKLASEKREVAKLARIVRAIRAEIGCSQAQAYRALDEFKNRYSSRR